MNFLLFYKHELSCNNTKGVITGSRLSFLKERYTIKEGQEISVGLIDGKLGKAKVIKMTNNEILFDVNLDKESPQKLDLTLIISICRPQTNKKILHIATSLGVKKIIFLRCDNIPKSYIQSTSLSEKNIKNECLLAMSQVGDTFFPEIKIYKSIFDCFNEEGENLINNNLNVIADTNCNYELNRDNFSNISNIKCIAIGPESGFSDKEIEYFHQKSFKSIGLGERILRVEVALGYIIGKING